MVKNDYLRRLQEQKHREIMISRKFTMQFCADAAIMAANEVFHRRGDILADFHNKFCEYAEMIAEMVVEDAKADKEIEYSKVKVDKCLEELLGDKFQPWDERYGGLIR